MDAWGILSCLLVSEENCPGEPSAGKGSNYSLALVHRVC